MPFKDLIPIISVAISALSAVITIVIYSYLGGSEMEKIRVQSSADFCFRAINDSSMVELYKKFLENDLYKKAKEKTITPGSSDTRTIGTYLNFLEYGAIIVQGLKINESFAASSIFVECTCNLYDGAKRHYLAAVDPAAFNSLTTLLRNERFWKSTPSCAKVWN